jgi:hypothetical protein
MVMFLPFLVAKNVERAKAYAGQCERRIYQAQETLCKKGGGPDFGKKGYYPPMPMPNVFSSTRF